jgi:hypothetical protein
MYDEPRDSFPPDRAALPAPDVRERVLSRCRREMAARRVAEHRQARWRWSAVAGVAALLLLNAVEERRISMRIGALVQGHAQVVKTPATGDAMAFLRTRATRLATLLRDPDAL